MDDDLHTVLFDNKMLCPLLQNNLSTFNVDKNITNFGRGRLKTWLFNCNVVVTFVTQNWYSKSPLQYLIEFDT